MLEATLKIVRAGAQYRVYLLDEAGAHASKVLADELVALNVPVQLVGGDLDTDCLFSFGPLSNEQHERLAKKFPLPWR